MKIGFLFAGIAIIFLQLITETLVEMVRVTQWSLLTIGIMLLVEGLAVDPKFGQIEKKIREIKEEIIELKYPLESNNED